MERVLRYFRRRSAILSHAALARVIEITQFRQIAKQMSIFFYK